MTSPSPRRRFQFSLRTLFVVVTILAIPCGYVGWQAKIVRARNAWLQSHHALLFRESPRISDQDPSAIRRLLGDKSHAAIGVTSDGEMAEGKRLFPEADVFVMIR